MPETDPTQGPETQEPEDQSVVSGEDRKWFQEMLAKPELTPEDREKLSNKYKGYDEAFKRKMSALSERESEVAQLGSDLRAAKEEKPQSTAALKTEGRKTIDALMDATTDPQQRETLRNLKTIIKEETDVEKLEAKVAKLEGLLETREKTTQATQLTKLETGLVGLRATYGDAIVDKHEDAIKRYGVQYPQYNEEDLLFKVAPPGELKQALEVQRRKKAAAGTPESKPKVEPSSVTASKGRTVSPDWGMNRSKIQRGRKNVIQEAVKLGFGKSTA